MRRRVVVGVRRTQALVRDDAVAVDPARRAVRRRQRAVVAVARALYGAGRER